MPPQIKVAHKELNLIQVVVSGIPERGGMRTAQSQQPQMFKSFSAFAVFALLGAGVVALPALAPKVEAGEVAALPKGDRLTVQAPSHDCSGQVWPNLATPCLRSADGGAKILEARLVTARR
jgi:hypothetical protein